MIYSSACANAIRALTQLALTNPDGFVLLDELCESAELPRHFVAKVFQGLVRHGLLVSSKGRGGGFSLARHPSDISLWDIVQAIDGTRGFDQCVVGIARCDDRQPCPQHDEWKGIRANIQTYLQETNLEKMSFTLQKKLDRISGKKGRRKKRSSRSSR